MGQPPEPHYPSWYAAQIEKLPAVQMEMPKYKEESPEEVAITVAPCSLSTTIGWFNVLNELNQMGYVICRRVNEEN